jgi:hypothetical protein
VDFPGVSARLRAARFERGKKALFGGPHNFRRLGQRADAVREGAESTSVPGDAAMAACDDWVCRRMRLQIRSQWLKPTAWSSV